MHHHALSLYVDTYLPLLILVPRIRTRNGSSRPDRWCSELGHFCCASCPPPLQTKRVNRTLIRESQPVTLSSRCCWSNSRVPNSPQTHVGRGARRRTASAGRQLPVVACRPSPIVYRETSLFLFGLFFQNEAEQARPISGFQVSQSVRAFPSRSVPSAVDMYTQTHTHDSSSSKFCCAPVAPFWGVESVYDSTKASEQKEGGIC